MKKIRHKDSDETIVIRCQQKKRKKKSHVCLVCVFCEVGGAGNVYHFPKCVYISLLSYFGRRMGYCVGFGGKQ